MCVLYFRTLSSLLILASVLFLKLYQLDIVYGHCLVCCTMSQTISIRYIIRTLSSLLILASVLCLKLYQLDIRTLSSLFVNFG